MVKFEYIVKWLKHCENENACNYYGTLFDMLVYDGSWVQSIKSRDGFEAYISTVSRSATLNS